MQATQDSAAATTFDFDDSAFPASVRDLRRAATTRFQARGYPTQREEDWKYTDVTPIARGGFGPAPLESARIAALLDVARRRLRELAVVGPRLVFINGAFVAELSEAGPAGIEARSFSLGGWDLVGDQIGQAAAIEGNPFVALNTAMLSDGAAVHVGARVASETAINLVFLGAAAGSATHPRILISVGESAEATVVETYASLDDEPRFTNPVTEVLVGNGAILSHGRLGLEGEQALHVGAVEARLGRDSVLRSLHVAAAGRITRTDVNVTFTDEGGDCTLNGLYLASAGRHADNHTLIDHAVPHCTSRQLYKGVIGDEATGVFNGKVIVRPGAQKTDANQTNKNLLLSTRATVDTKPQLEIYADDVRCTHGAAVGPPDPETLFYLQSRGLGVDEAIRLLAFGFGADVLREWPLRGAIEPTVLDRIAATVAGGRPR